MPIITAAIASAALGIAVEEWEKIPASKKGRIRKALEQKDVPKAKRIYMENPKALKYKEEGEFIHVRIKRPSAFHEESFRVIKLGNGIKATIGCPKKARFEGGKCQNGTQIQKLMFEKGKWTLAKIKSWIKKHPKIKARRKR